jgi:branched-chain amino acid transport system ATP-binding protein
MGAQVTAGRPGGDLSVEDLKVSYGQSQALMGISLSAASGEVLSILGPNGAGKSTLGRAVSGLVPVSGGRIRFGGTEITGWKADRIRRAGLTYIPEGRGIFPGLNVSDNLRMATRQLGGRADRRAGVDRAIALFPPLGSRMKQQAGSLSGGEQQMLAMARALAVEPRLIIADEMSLGLAPLVVEQVFERLEVARAAGITILLIEQYVKRALAIADRCVIMTRGVVSWTGPASQAGPEVLDRYLGNSSARSDEPADGHGPAVS